MTENTKTVDGTISKYEYVGDQLFFEQRGEKAIHYVYDSFGNVMAARCRIPDPAFYRLGRGILELYGMRIVHLHVVEFHGPVGVHHGHLAVDLLPGERFGDIAGIRARGVGPVVDGIGILRGIYGERAALIEDAPYV